MNLTSIQSIVCSVVLTSANLCIASELI